METTLRTPDEAGAGLESFAPPTLSLNPKGSRSHKGTLAHHLPTDSRQIPSDLVAVMAAWPTLPDVVRAGILAMVRAARIRE
jgi:hypothetical protein